MDKKKNRFCIGKLSLYMLLSSRSVYYTSNTNSQSSLSSLAKVSGVSWLGWLQGLQSLLRLGCKVFLNVLEIFKKMECYERYNCRKSKIKSTNIPRKLTINKVDVYNKPEIADAFNGFFTNIGQELDSQIPKSSKTFETYISKVNVKMESKPLSINELKDAFFSLKINKSSGVDDVSFNIIKKCFGVLFELLIYLFRLSLEKGVFPDDLKIAKVTPIYKTGDNSDRSNYRPTSVLPCFSKILERLRYNFLYKYLKENNILHEKQFSFQAQDSTSDAIVQLVDKIFDSFEKEQFTPRVFIDLSKAFDTVDHSILLEKLKLYGITGKNLA